MTAAKFEVGQLVTVEPIDSFRVMTGRVTDVEEHDDGSVTYTPADPALADSCPGWTAVQ